MCRVVLLAPLVAGLAARRARRAGGRMRSVPVRGLVPGFVAGFLAAALLRSSGLVPAGALSAARTVETALLCTAMVALGTGVRVDRMRRLGLRPVLLGTIAWAVVVAVGLGVAFVVGTGARAA